MRRVPDLLVALLWAVGGPPRHVHQSRPWNEITLGIESIAQRPVTVCAIGHPAGDHYEVVPAAILITP